MSLNGENIICFAGEDWWYHNPHSNLHIMKEFAKHNRVLFVNSIGVRMPDFKTDPYAWKRIFGKLKSLAKYIKLAEPNIYVMTPLAIPLLKGSEVAIRAINRNILNFQLRLALGWLKMKDPILWVCLPTMKDVAMRLNRKAKCFAYYCVDNIAHFEGGNPAELLTLERDIMKEADVAFFVSHDLYEEKKALNANTHVLSHGVDYDHFAKAATAGITPKDLQDLQKPIIGYVGAIKDLDFDLVAYLAGQNPELTFVFIGDLYSETQKLAPYKNVRFLGKKRYEDLPDYMREFDVCCLYYKVGDAFNDYRNPKKLLEYLATGKPIVSVDIRELKYFKDVVYISDSYEHFDSNLKLALSEKSKDLSAKRMQTSESHTWERVAEKAGGYITSCLRK